MRDGPSLRRTAVVYFMRWAGGCNVPSTPTIANSGESPNAISINVLREERLKRNSPRIIGGQGEPRCEGEPVERGEHEHHREGGKV